MESDDGLFSAASPMLSIQQLLLARRQELVLLVYRSEVAVVEHEDYHVGQPLGEDVEENVEQ